jgi:hypothetical protein
MKLVKAGLLLATSVGLTAAVYRGRPLPGDLPNRLPEAAPYVTAEAQAFPPPYEEHWQGQNHPGQCQTCHARIFDQWNGSMMSNSWRDPVWRAAFLLLARTVSTNGECDTPAPPDGTPKASHNPFARAGACASDFDIGTGKVALSRPGSLLDGFCSRCHMPTNYVDNVPLRDITVDATTGRENAPVDTRFNPTSDNGTGLAFATLDAQLRNTESGKSGIFCAVCHSFAATRDTPFHNYERAGIEYVPVAGRQSRGELLGRGLEDLLTPSARTRPNLGYSIGAGSFRLSPHALAFPDRVGPLLAGTTAGLDLNTGETFGQPIAYQTMDASKHKGHHQALFVRSEMCAACHDVTNPLPIKNQLGRWVGGFPIERTYTEWAGSRYADRPGNANYQPAFRRDCQSCHMQQDYGQPGTAQTLYQHGAPLPAQVAPVANEGPQRPFFTHHFVGGNAFVPRLVGKALDAAGSVAPYPELSVYSYSSADHKSVYSRGFWTHVDRAGVYTQQARMAWDRLRHVLGMELAGPAAAAAGASVPLSITVANTGSGHNFPTGFPEGRIAWLAVHAYDLGTGRELPIRDSFWQRTSVGVGNLTTAEMADPAFPRCHWELPAGSADPFAIQWKAVASLGDGCPTLDLPFAPALNLVTNDRGLPVDKDGRAITAASNPGGLPQFRDLNGNGDPFDDAFLRDSRLRPMPHAGATQKVDRYAVVVPADARGPIAVSAAVYYQSVEAIVAAKFLGNMVDSNENFVLEPCVLGGACDGRIPSTEPAVVEGAPPVPMIVRNLVLAVEGQRGEAAAPRVSTYPAPGAERVYQDVVIKAFFSAPVRGVDRRSFTLTDASGAVVPAGVDQIGDGAWGLFPDSIRLHAGERYTAHLARGLCDFGGRCTADELAWAFTVAREGQPGAGDTSVPPGFSRAFAGDQLLRGGRAAVASVRAEQDVAVRRNDRGRSHPR